jgi:hypothetical protein
MNGGQDQIYVVIETALQTRSGQQQSWARDFLIELPSIIAGSTSINGTPVVLSEGQYIIPVAQSTARPDGDVVYEVQSGQSLWSIAITLWNDDRANPQVEQSRRQEYRV